MVHGHTGTRAGIAMQGMAGSDIGTSSTWEILREPRYSEGVAGDRYSITVWSRTRVEAGGSRLFTCERHRSHARAPLLRWRGSCRRQPANRRRLAAAALAV